MSLLEHPQAQALLEDAEVSAENVRGCQERLSRFMQRYLPLFTARSNAGLPRLSFRASSATCSVRLRNRSPTRPTAKRKPVQHFVGAGKWDDDAVTCELRRHVGEELGDADGVLIVDGSAFAKKGTEWCGVARQWCGRLGKIDNC
jgi:SRSO17 transposase